MSRLSEAQKTYIVQQLACFVGAAEIQRHVKEFWAMELTFQAIAHYDPEVPSTKTPKKWLEIHRVTREGYLKEAAKVGIANARWRMEQRQVLYERAGQNAPLRLQILEQAEKAEGGMFTNTRRLDHSGKIEGTGVLFVPTTAEGEWDRIAREAQAADHGGG